MKKIIRPILVGVALSSMVVSCNRYLDITPTGEVIPQSVQDFRGMLTRGYELYPEHKALVNLKSDEVKANFASEELKALFTWGESEAAMGSVLIPYESLYQTIFYANYIIENAPKNIAGEAEYNQIMGEAYALRAYTYFELLNLYAPVYNGSNGSELAVPLITVSDLEREFPRESLDKIYAQIFSDIESAKSLLNISQYSAGYNYRFTSTALNALRARIHQYRGEWAQAINAAKEVLAVNSILEDFNTSFTLPSSFKSVESIMNLDKGLSGATNSFSRVSDSHIALFDQTNDLRFSSYFKKNGANWQTTKYSDSNEFKVSFRVGEIMLIKAEAEYKLGNEAGSKSTLLALAAKRYNVSGISNFVQKMSNLSGDAYYSELLNERARELSFEGLRWFDLRRTTKPEIVHKFDGVDYTLSAGDVRYTIPFPIEAKLKNPLLK